MNKRIRRKIGKKNGFHRFTSLEGVTLSELLPYKNVRRFINIYDVDLAWGGPAEGGWWFETGTPVMSLGALRPGSMRFKSRLHQAQAFVAEENRGKPPISSVLSRGKTVVCVELAPPKAFPEKRPQYS